MTTYSPYTDDVKKVTLDANSIIKADADNTPVVLAVSEQTLLGRITAGVIEALSVTQIRTLLNISNVDDTTDANKPISSATQTALDGKVDENVAIVGATKTKITYDAKGLVTVGADATTTDIADSTDKRYVTDAQLVVIGNTSGTNSGDNAANTSIAATKLDDFATPDDNTNLDANTTNHGLLLKATAPAAGLTNVVAIENGETVYKNKALFDATDPSTQAYGDAAAVGTAVTSARRDHKHAMPASEKDTTAQTGILKGNGSAISAASQGTDYYAPGGTDVAIVDGGTGASTALAALSNLGIKVVRKTADETISNSAVLQDDDELLFTIGANEIWLFETYIRFSMKAASDFKFTFTVPAGATGGWNYTVDSVHTGNERAFGASSSPISTSDQTPTLRVIGTVINGATAGNLTFQWSQATGVAEDTIVFANSSIIAHKLN